MNTDSWLGNLLRKILCKNMFKLVNETALEVVERFTKNKDLQAMLLAQYGDHAVVFIFISSSQYKFLVCFFKVY